MQPKSPICTLGPIHIQLSSTRQHIDNNTSINTLKLLRLLVASRCYCMATQCACRSMLLPCTNPCLGTASWLEKIVETLSHQLIIEDNIESMSMNCRLASDGKILPYSHWKYCNKHHIQYNGSHAPKTIAMLNLNSGVALSSTRLRFLGALEMNKLLRALLDRHRRVTRSSSRTGRISEFRE